MNHEYRTIRPADIKLGEPLPFDVFDQNHRLLLCRGAVVESADQLTRLALQGLYRQELVQQPAPLAQKPAAPAEQPRARPRTVALEDTHLAVGESLQVQTGSDAANRCSVKCIGYFAGLGLALTMPTRVHNLREGQPVEIRYFNGRNIYTFSSTVIRLSTLPGPHFWVELPASVTSTRIRGQDRVRANLVCAVVNEQVTHAGVITNLSTGGVSLSLKGNALMAKGSAVQLNFKLTVGDLESIVSVAGEVANVAQDQPDAPYQYGIRFTNVPSASALALTAYVYQARAEGMGVK